MPDLGVRTVNQFLYPIVPSRRGLVAPNNCNLMPTFGPVLGFGICHMLIWHIFNKEKFSLDKANVGSGSDYRLY